MAALRVHVEEASDLIQVRSSIFGGSSRKVWVEVRVDDGSPARSAAVDPAKTTPFDLREDLQCPPGASTLHIEVSRAKGWGGSETICGCDLPLASLQQIDRQMLPLYTMDGRSSPAGCIRVSVMRLGASSGGLMSVTAPGGAAIPGALVNRSLMSQPQGLQQQQPPPAHSQVQTLHQHSGGLTNQAGLVSHAAPLGSSGPPPLSSMRAPVASIAGGASGSSASSPGPAVPSQSLGASPGLHSYSGGPNSYAGSCDVPQPPIASAAGGIPNRSMAATSSLGIPLNSIGGSSPPLTSTLKRGSTGGLANQAEASEDGTRANALPQAEEILKDLHDGFSPGNEEQRRRLQRALEHLHSARKSDQESEKGKAAAQQCSEHVTAVFDHALAVGSVPLRENALWFAGRVAGLSVACCDDQDTLQEILKRRLDSVQMKEAFDRAEAVVMAAADSNDALEKFMDDLELAEFHGLHTQEDAARADRLLSKLKDGLSRRLRSALQARRLDELESALGFLGNPRTVEFLGLQDVQQELQRLRGLELLRGALLPVHGQVGFPELKRRQLRHAVMTVQATLSDDRPKNMQELQAKKELQDILFLELIPACAAHSDESMQESLRAALQVRLQEAEVWAAAERAFDTVRNRSREDSCSSLLKFCEEINRRPPQWLMEQLRKMYRMPSNWDVESMVQGDKMLNKIDITDRDLLKHFDRVLKRTAQPDIRTRDRTGTAPRSFTAVRAVQIENARNWQKYLRGRDRVAEECRNLRARHDDDHWRDNLNGHVMSMAEAKDSLAQYTSEPLLREANEMWLLHGTSHAAAEGITSEDFDMTRANPSGLFGAGVYFAESVSKADEYVTGAMEHGKKVFPLLLCRVALGYIYYCDERRPDKSRLVDRCIQKEWHSVLGDRKKTSGTFREFIIYDNLQAFPAYIIYYTQDF